MECTPFAWEVAWFCSGRNPFRIFTSFASLSPVRGDPRKSSTVRFRGFQCVLFLLFCYRNKGKIWFSKESVRSPELLREPGWNLLNDFVCTFLWSLCCLSQDIRTRLSGKPAPEEACSSSGDIWTKTGDAEGVFRMLGLGLGKEQLPQSRKLSHAPTCDAFP